MSHLSNLRLTLTLYGRGHETPLLAEAMADVARSLDHVLSGELTASQQTPSSDPAMQLAIAVVPNLAAQVRRTLFDASRLASESSRIEASLDGSK
jgi:hypothetical protein